MYASSVIARGKAALQGSETEQRIAVLLYDDAVQVISSFELNQLASLTYHEAQVITSADRDMTDIILEHLEQIMKAPANYSTVSVQKSLVVAKHILLHGAEKIVQPIRMQLGRYVEQLTHYNTVLLAQQQTGGAWLMRLKGGSVDYGGPVREAAVALHNLLQSPQQLQFERRVSADPNSLVPVGDKQRVAFATDEVRLQHLKKQMEEQQRIITKSNLQKATDGFGSGYMAKDGKTVVGAAHGIEEMLQQQQREEQKFRDEAKARQQRQQQQEGVGGYSEYQAPSFSQAPTYGINNTISRQEAPQPPQEADLIGFDQHPSPAAAAAPEMDLLDFGSTANATTTTAPPQHEEDLLFGGSETYTSTATSHHHHDPFTTAAAGGLIHATSTPEDDNNNLSTTTTPMPSVSEQQQAPGGGIMKQSMSVMASNEDRFAALDALAGGGGSASSFAGAPSSMTTTTNNAFSGLGSITAAAAPPNIGALTDLSGLTASSSKPPAFAMSTAEPPAFAMPAVSLSSIRISEQSLGFATTSSSDNKNLDDSENGFVMGGTEGAGLAPAPATPPPPPPPPPPAGFW